MRPTTATSEVRVRRPEPATGREGRTATAGRATHPFTAGTMRGKGNDDTIGPTRIREVAERNAKLLALRPDKGHLTGVTKARIENGLRCVIEEGPWKLAADMPVKAGGAETAPTPGMLGRGALASCLAMGITVWAARLEIPITALEVEVQADFDARGELGVGENIPPGYQEVRYLVSIESPASGAAVAELLETAERHSPYLDVFSCAQSMKRIVCLNGEEA